MVFNNGLLDGAKITRPSRATMMIIATDDDD